ncbi:solute carrier family 22 member 7-like [Pseudophryne corroboree]|uniref:solute carrier family 22 member 7-like n=1 Tax=Pseudophryne corroboree TaxID=495146 RepID=UPI003081BDF2
MDLVAFPLNSDSAAKKLNFDDLLIEAGGFGRFQVLTLLILCIPRIIIPLHFLQHIFISAVPPHHCAIPNLENTGNLSQEELLLINIPREADGTFSSCTMYSQAQPHLLLNRSQKMVNESLVEGCHHGWTYDVSVFSSTTASEWNLVCEKKWLNQALVSFFYGGLTVGAITIGYLSDRYGRRLLLLLSFILALGFGMMSAASVSYLMLAISLSLSGFCFSGLTITVVALSVEWVDTEHRTVAGIITSFTWSLGSAILALLAYLLRDWRWLVVVITAPCVLGIISIWWLSESARWLLTEGKPEKAETELMRCAASNGQRLDTFSKNSENIRRLAEPGPSTANSSYIDLFRTPRLRRISFCVGLVWFGVAFSYYGISLNITGFGLNIFLTHFLYALVEFPGKMGTYFLMNHLGRRRTQVLTLLVTGVCIGLNVVIPACIHFHTLHIENVSCVPLLLGKRNKTARLEVHHVTSVNCLFLDVLCVSCDLLLHHNVLSHRQKSAGYTSFVGRIAVTIVPLVMLLDNFWYLLPQVIFCSMAVVCSLIAYLLPETKNVCLPETINDTEHGSGPLHGKNEGVPNFLIWQHGQKIDLQPSPLRQLVYCP